MYCWLFKKNKILALFLIPFSLNIVLSIMLSLLFGLFKKKVVSVQVSAFCLICSRDNTLESRICWNWEIHAILSLTYYFSVFQIVLSVLEPLIVVFFYCILKDK